MSLRALLLASILASIVFSPPAFAKKVEVEWKKIKGAAKYEIQIEKDGTVVLKKMLDDTVWKGPLDFGVYSYEIRAYDKVKRPGTWSAPAALVVMPSPPELVSPDGDSVKFYGHESKMTLKWKPVPGATKYLVDVKNGDKAVFHDTVTETKKEIAHLPPGDYRWQVTAIVEASGRTPASFTGRKWESKPSDSDKFHMVQEKLDSPDLIAPKGDMKPPPGGKLAFKWSPVSGAEAYEIRVIEILPKGRALASDPETTLHAKGTSVTANISGEGRYRWEVRALASIDANNAPEAIGPKSTADFNIDRNTGFLEGAGYVAASMMLAPYSYQVAPFSGGKETASSSAMDLRLSGEYWFKPQWGIAAGFDDAIFQIDGNMYTRFDEELALKYRFNITGQKYPWYFAPKIGFLRRGYPYIVPQNTGGQGSGNSQSENPADFTLFNVNAIGPTAGFDLRKQLSDKLSVGLKFAYFYPIVVDNGTSLDSGGTSANSRNFSLGAQGLYWLSARVGLGAGIFIEKRSIAIEQNGQGAALYMDGSYFFGSLIYSFGR